MALHPSAVPEIGPGGLPRHEHWNSIVANAKLTHPDSTTAGRLVFGKTVKVLNETAGTIEPYSLFIPEEVADKPELLDPFFEVAIKPQTYSASSNFSDLWFTSKEQIIVDALEPCMPILAFEPVKLSYNSDDGVPEYGDKLGPVAGSFKVSKMGSGMRAVADADTDTGTVWAIKIPGAGSTGDQIFRVRASSDKLPGESLLADLYTFDPDSSTWEDSGTDITVDDVNEEVCMISGEFGWVFKKTPLNEITLEGAEGGTLEDASGDPLTSAESGSGSGSDEERYDFIGPFGLNRRVKMVGNVEVGLTGSANIMDDSAGVPVETSMLISIENGTSAEFGHRKLFSGEELFVNFYGQDGLWHVTSVPRSQFLGKVSSTVNNGSAGTMTIWDTSGGSLSSTSRTMGVRNASGSALEPGILLRAEYSQGSTQPVAFPYPVKSHVHFKLAATLTTDDASAAATIQTQIGPGFDNPNTSITVHNLPSSAGGFVFEGGPGSWGIAVRDDSDNYYIQNMQCP